MSNSSSCGMYHFAEREGFSNDTQLFLSPLCLPNSLKFGTLVASMAIYSLSSLSVLFLLIHSLITKRAKVPKISLFFAYLVHTFIALQAGGHALGTRGVLRMVLICLPLGPLLSGVSYLSMEWFRIIARNSMTTHSQKPLNLRKIYFIFAIIYNTGNIAGAIVTGAQDLKNPRANNIASNTNLTWSTIAVCGIAGAVFWQGRKVFEAISESLSFSQDAETNIQLNEIAQKVKRYSLLQSLVWLTAGTTGVIISIWAFINIDNPTQLGYYFFIHYYVITPCMCCAAWLLVYASLRMKAEDTPNQSKVTSGVEIEAKKTRSITE